MEGYTGDTTGVFPLNEDDLFDELTRLYADADVQFLPMPPASLFDRMGLESGVLTAYVEAKSRNVPSTRYTHPMVDALKHYYLVAHQLDTQVRSVLYTSYSDGVVLKTRPADMPPLPLALSTPGGNAVSQNRGKVRPVVHYSPEFLTPVPVVRTHSSTPPVVPRLARTGFTPMDRAAKTQVEKLTGGKVHQMHTHHPLNGWLQRDGALVTWLDVRASGQRSTDDVLVVEPSRFDAVTRHEAIFADTAAWLVVRFADDVVLALHPNVPMLTFDTLGPDGDVRWRALRHVPRDFWVPLADVPFTVGSTAYL